MTTAAAPPAAPVDTRALQEAPAWRRALAANGMWVLGLDFVLILVFTLKSQNFVFWSAANLQNQMLNGSEGLLLALAMTMLLAAGLIDLSVGANLAMASVLGARTMIVVAGGKVGALGGAGDTNHYSHVGFALFVSVIVCIVSGMVFGAINGLIIAYLRVNSLIATLGTLSIGLGLVDLITSGSDIGGLPSQLQDDFGLKVLPGHIPYPAVVALIVAVCVWAVMRYLRFGLYTLAIGSSRVSAERAAIKVRPHLLKLTMAAGALAGLAGFIDLAHFGATTINGHNNDPLAAITAAVIGGAALAGGRISVVGTVWGSALSGILLGGLVIINVSSFYQLIAIGTILVAAVAIDQFRNRRRDSR